MKSSKSNTRIAIATRIFFEAKAQKNLVIVVALPKDVLLKGEDVEGPAQNLA